MQRKIKKAVFPVAGWGTRFLPATKSCPKEMLTVVDKPLIQYAVEEAIGAGIEELIFVTSSNKKSLEDHFDKNFELEYSLEQKGKDELLKIVKSILPPHVKIFFVRQPEALGLGHAILCAKPLVGIEDFVVILPDDLMINFEGNGALKQMFEYLHSQHDCNGLIAVQEVPIADVSVYGVVDIKDNIIANIIEKPSVEKAPSNLAVVGRYILPNEIFFHLDKIDAGSGGEIQLTDAIDKLIKTEKNVLAYKFQGTRFDCGDKLGFVIANYELAKRHHVLGREFLEYIAKDK